MDRRSFVSRALAFVGLAAVPVAAATSPGASADPDVIRNGRRFCRVFRKADDGEYHETTVEQLRPGDKVISLGLNQGRLWRVEKFTVGPKGSWFDRHVNDWACDVANGGTQNDDLVVLNLKLGIG